METYNDKIAGNDKVELIMASADNTDDAALAWAKKHKFPWPTVLKDKVKRSGLSKYEESYVPQYVLIDKHGKKLAGGKAAVLAKAIELSK